MESGIYLKKIQPQAVEMHAGFKRILMELPELARIVQWGVHGQSSLPFALVAMPQKEQTEHVTRQFLFLSSLDENHLLNEHEHWEPFFAPVVGSFSIHPVVIEVDPPHPAVSIPIHYLDHYERSWPKPNYAKPGDAGFDLRAAFHPEQTGEMIDTQVIPPGDNLLVPTGIRIALPRNMEIEIRPRSGRAHKDRLCVTNSPGTIDAGYRNEIFVSAENRSDKPIIIKRGERIAQAVIKTTVKGCFKAAETLPSSERGMSGFGASGKS